MNKIILNIILVSIIAITQSCTITQELRIAGKPGTSIYDSNGKMLSTIDYSGSTTITINRNDKYQYFLQAKSPGSNILVPFALDYTNNNRAVDWERVGWTSVLCPPLAGVLIYGWWGLLSDYGVDDDFDYLVFQKTNNDLIRE